MRVYLFAGVFAIALTISALTAQAWTGPTLPPGCTSAGGSPPSCNTSAPLNVGTLSQVKNGVIGVNGLGVYGNSLLDWNVNGGGTITYLNFSDLSSNPLTQSSGYGIRDNAGTLEFKNSGGSWQSLQAIVSGLGGGLWTQSGSSIYYTTGYVGIDTPSPSSALTVNGTITNSSSANNWWSSNALDLDGGDGTLYAYNLDDAGGNVDMTLNGGTATFNVGPYTNDWFRVNGSGGIYWQSYGGGWNMQDSTWIRSYGGKPVYMANGFDTGSGSQSGVGCNGGAVGAGYTWYVCGTSYTSGDVTIAGGGGSALNVSNGGINTAGGVTAAQDSNFNGGGYGVYVNDGGIYVAGASNFSQDLTDYGGNYAISTPNGGINIAGGSNFSSGLNVTGELGITGASNNWAEVINWAPPSSGAYYGLLVGTGPSGYSQFQNGSGYYSQLAYSSWGLYTNGNIYSGGSMQANAFYYNSDERLKKNIVTIASSTALSDVLALRPVTYNWIDPSMGTTTQLGFIAQEVQQVVPQIVQTNASTTMESVDYARVTPLLVGSVQALDQTIQDQQQQIDSQQSQITSQEAQISQLQAEVQTLLNK